MTERQSRYALERAQPVRYIVTAETLQHFQHLDCPAGPGYWSIGDGDASLAYYCPYCGALLAPPEVTPPAESLPGVSAALAGSAGGGSDAMDTDKGGSA